MNEYKHGAKTGAGRRVLLAGMGLVLGGLSLGGGLAAGARLTEYFAAKAIAASELAPEFSFANDHVTVAPVSVKLDSFRDAVQSAAETVVSINVKAVTESFFGQRETPGAGSGFIFETVDDTVYIATNNHVVEGVSDVTVSLDDEESVPAQIVGRDPQSDLAVLSVSKAELDALGVPYRAAAFGDSSAAQVGDQVVAIGNSLGEGQVATSGIISATGRQIEIEGKQLNVMQTDAAINMGNSGGPLVNAKGEVIGINTAKTMETGVEGMGYSIPIHEAAPILQSLRADGMVKKPYLGVLNPRTVTDDIQAMYNLPSKGVLAVGVDEASGAAEAGLEPWDIIVGFNDEKIETVEALQSAMAGTETGDTVTVQVYRGGERLDLQIVLGVTPE